MSGAESTKLWPLLTACLVLVWSRCGLQARPGLLPRCGGCQSYGRAVGPWHCVLGMSPEHMVNRPVAQFKLTSSEAP